MRRSIGDREVVEGVGHRRLGLVHRDADERQREPLDQVVCHHRGQALDQVVRPALDQLDHPIADRAVVDGILEAVGRSRLVAERLQGEVDQEVLAVAALVLEHPVAGEHLQAADLDQHAARIRAQTSSASRLGRTSCTRNIHAPRSSAATLAAMVAARRWVSSRPVIAPRNRLRETAISSG